MFHFNDEITILNEWLKTRALHTFVGFENNFRCGKGKLFNFILSNGTRSTQRDEEDPTKYTFKIPAYVLNKIRRVSIHYYDYHIEGFSFFDKDGALLWSIGLTYTDDDVETVLLSENEVIVGVVAKLYPSWLSAYTDF